jgi:archaellum biogenesis protein FlaJ (TadC family)
MSKIKALLLSVAFAIAILLLSSLMITHTQVMTLMSIIVLVIVTYIYLTTMEKKTKTESELVQPALEFKPSSKFVGSYCLGGKTGMCIWFEKKPNLFHRTMMKMFLGWEWTDVTKN